MKKKKMITENPNISRSDKKNGRLVRYRERLEKERLERQSLLLSEKAKILETRINQ